MQVETARTLYEARIIRWGSACILCSLRRHPVVEGPHDWCLQIGLQSELDRFRHALDIQKYSACFGCLQPSFVCAHRGKEDCRQPFLIRHVCWAAVAPDFERGAPMVQAIGDRGWRLQIQWTGVTSPGLGRRRGCSERRPVSQLD